VVDRLASLLLSPNLYLDLLAHHSYLGIRLMIELRSDFADLMPA
jgi:hypothetical protein